MNTLVQGLSNTALTENGALTYASTASALLDFYYHAAAKRGQDNTQLFAAAYAENPQAAVAALFYVRDVRGGQGERKTFRDCLLWLYNDRDAWLRVINLVPEYGRWDDLLEYVSDIYVQEVVARQLKADMASEHPSLLGKWLPSNNTSSKATCALAQKWAIVIGMKPGQYRRMLSSLRAKIKIVETQMASRKWESIEYDHVPSRASMIYRKAFGKHDETRYKAYLDSVTKGEKVIHSGTLYPYEIVYRLRNGAPDATLEAQWKALPNYADTDAPALVVCDTSGSMSADLAGTKAQSIDISTSLAIYLAERNRGPFKDVFITFSTQPTFIRLTGATLKDRITQVYRSNWDGSTDLQAAMRLILDTAQHYHVPESDMPRQLFIVSDMEFNSALNVRWWHPGVPVPTTNMDGIRALYDAAGYTLPDIVFWNVASRNMQTPVTKDETGVYLVSGCSPSIFKNAINTKAATPMELMMEVLRSPRYEPVWKALEA